MVWQRILQRMGIGGLAIALSVGLMACGGDRALDRQQPMASAAVINISEVAPPIALEELRQQLDGYQPQVTIVSPQPDAVLESDRVSVQFSVQDLPLFKDEQLGLGPHLHVFLDDGPYTAVYDPSVPLVFENLAVGSHTLRAFASRPWHESFKNNEAYAQVTFHVFTKTDEHRPSANQPLLTYSRPQGSYGAEPIMLDFYLTHAPLHLVARQDNTDDIKDWMIRCTVNGESFLIDDWQPIYLEGFKPGQNWVQLELLDEDGQAIANAFNNTARLITYEPGGQDTLSRLVRGDLNAAQALKIVDPTAILPSDEVIRLERSIQEPAKEPAEDDAPALKTPQPDSTSPDEDDVQEPDLETAPAVEPEDAPAESTVEPASGSNKDVEPTSKQTSEQEAETAKPDITEPETAEEAQPQTETGETMSDNNGQAIAPETPEEPEQTNPPSEDLPKDLPEDLPDDAAPKLSPSTPEAIAPEVTSQPDTSTMELPSPVPDPGEQSLVKSSNSSAQNTLDNSFLIP
ncbi:MAG TPA: hypothetical protein V6D20_12255 [Candidatus Obscuribacterales bacterium]